MKRPGIINYVALASIQASNALIPIFIFPYALSVLGDGEYAKLAITEAIMIASLCFVLYSFEIDGVAQITRFAWPQDILKMSRIFSQVLCARLSNFGFCLVAVFLSSPFLDKTTSDLLLLWLLVPLSYIFQANFFFQAIQNNAFVGVVTTLSRVIAALLIFELVTDPSDIRLVPLIIGLSYLSAALLSFYYAKKKFGIFLTAVPPLEVLLFLKYGWHVFIGNISVVLYRDLNVLFLGFVYTDPKAIATYSVAEKMVKGVQAVMRPLNQIFFPMVIKKISLFECPDKKSLSVIFNYTYPQLVGLTMLLFLIGCVCMLTYNTFADKIPESYITSETLILFLIMLPSVYFGILNFMFGVVGLNYLNKRVVLFRVILITGILSLLGCLFLGKEFGGFGAATTFTLSEALLFYLILKIYLN